MADGRLLRRGPSYKSRFHRPRESLYNVNTGLGVYEKNTGWRAAGRFDVDIIVTKILFVTIDVQLTSGDLAERFGVICPKIQK